VPMGITMRARATTNLAAPATRDGERGSMLIEVIVSGLLLALLAVGLFGAFDGSARVSVRNKERATSARLAQEDQERLRGLPITQISNLRASSPTVIGGVTYTVASRADWVADAAGNTTCAAGDARADYLKIQSTVTPSKAGAKPVVVESMINPKLGTFGAGSGSLAVEVFDPDDAGVAGLPVTITGPVSDSDATNADGCAFFGYEPTGNYTITYSAAGWVDYAGATSVSEATSVSSGAVSTKSLRYDRAGSATVSFDTSDAGTVQPASYDAVRLVHSNASRARDTGTDATTVTMTGLFPFKDAYAAYAGECDQNNPASYAVTPANPLHAAIVPRAADQAVTVRLPTIAIRVRKSGSSPATYLANRRVRFTSPCGVTPGTPRRQAVTDANGRARVALPYGDWTVCVDNQQTPALPTAQWRKSADTTVQNRNAAGTPETIIDLVESATGGSSSNVCA
jgi:Tfp pilus assembly protein PilX